MNNNQNNSFNNDEIDLVDLLGVLIKRRVFLSICFILVFLLSAVLLFIKEYNFVKAENLKASNQNICLECDYSYAINLKNDYLFNLYNILRNSHAKSINNPNFNFNNNYSDFLVEYLFDINFDKKNILFISFNNLNYYLFKDIKTLEDFKVNYKLTYKNNDDLKKHRNTLKDYEAYQCLELSVEDLKTASLTCKKLRFYYFSFIDRISLALKTNLNFSFFTLDSVLAIQDNSIFEEISIAELDNKLKTASLNNLIKFDKSKYIKYLIISLILSFIVSVFLVYIYEFYLSNKERLKKYL